MPKIIKYSFLIAIVFFTSLPTFWGCAKKLRPGVIGEEYSLDFSFKPDENPWDELSRRKKAADAGDAIDIFALAVQYAKMGFLDSADVAFRNAVRSAPDDVSLLLKVGYYFERYRRMPEEAIKFYRRATKLSSKKRDIAFYRWGITLLRTGNVKKAVEQFKYGANAGDSLGKIWQDVFDLILNKLNSPQYAESFLKSIASKHSDKPEFAKLFFSIHRQDDDKVSDSEVERLAKSVPFCHQIIKIAREQYQSADSAELFELSYDAKAHSIDALLLGMELLRRGFNYQAVATLQKYAQSPEEKIMLADFLLDKYLPEYSYQVVAPLASSGAFSESLEKRAKIIAGMALLKCKNVGIGRPLPKVFGADEPNIIGGALSVLTDRRDVSNFVSALQSAENMLYAQRQGEKILKAIIEKYPDDVCVKPILHTLQKLAEARGNYKLATEMYEKEIAITKERDEQINILLQMMRLYNKDKSKYEGIAWRILHDYGDCKNIANCLSDISWRIGYLYGKSRAISFLKKVHRYWVKQPYSKPVPIENLRTIRGIILARLKKSERCSFVWEFVEDDPYWNTGAVYAIECATDVELLAMAEKFPLQRLYLEEFLKRLTRSNQLLTYADAVRDSVRSSETDFGLLLRSAEAQYWASHFESALPIYEELVNMRPDWDWLIERTGEIAHSLGDTAKAIECFRQLVFLQPQEQKWVDRLGDIMEQSGNRADSIWSLKVYDEPLKKSSWGDLAAVHWDYGRYENGEEVIRRARKFFNDETIFAKEMGAMLDWMERYDEALNEYITALGSADQWDAREISDWIERLFRHSKKPRKYRRRFERRISPSLNAPAVLDVYSSQMLELGDTNDVLEKLHDIANEGRNNAVLSAVAKWAMKLRHHNIAARANERCFEITDDAQFLITAAEIMEDAHNTTSAEKFYQKAAQHDAELKTAYGKFLLRSKMFKKARKVFAGVVRTDSMNAYAISNLATSLLGEGRTKEAREVLTDAIERFKKSAQHSSFGYDAEIRLLRMKLAHTYDDDEPNSALAAYERLLNKYPTDARILRETWQFAKSKNLMDKLIDYYETVSREAPKNYRWNMVLYWLCRWEHRVDDARRWLAKACDNEPQRSSLWRIRFQTAFVQGDFQDAQTAMNHLKRLGADKDDWNISLLIAIGKIDSAVHYITEPVRKYPMSRHSYYRVCRDLISRGLFTNAKQYANRAMQLEDGNYCNSYEYLSRIAELEEKPDLAVSYLSQALRKMHRNSSRWRADNCNHKIAQLLARWHYIEETIPDIAQTAGENIYARNLLEYLYREGGDLKGLAQMLNYDPNQMAKQLYRAKEYDILLQLCHQNSIVSVRNVDVSEFNKLAYCATALWQSGDRATAQRMLISMPEISPKNPYLYLTAADAFLRNGQYDDAERFIKRGSDLKKYPDARFQRMLANIYIARADTTAAVKLMLKLPANEREQPNIWRIRFLLNIGRTSDAKKLLRRRIDYAVSQLEYEHYYWDSDGEDELMQSYGLWDLLDEKYARLADAAENDWEKNNYLLDAARYALMHDPQRASEMAQSILEKQQSYDAITIYAEALKKMKRPHQAVRFLESSDLPLSSLGKKLADFYYEANDTASANDILLAKLEENLDEATFASVLTTLIEREQYATARRIGEIAYKLWGGSPKIWMLFGEALVQSGETERGMKLIERAAYQRYDKYSSDKAIERWARLTVQYGQVQSTIGWAKAQIRSDETRAHRRFVAGRLIALISRETEDKNAAIAAADELVKEFPMEMDAYETQIQIYRWAGKNSQAEEIERYVETHFYSALRYEDEY